MRLTSVGQLLYAIGFLSLGTLGLIFDDYAMNWQQVPSWFPAHDALAYLSALLLFGSAVGLLIRRVQIGACIVLTGFLLLWLVALRIPPLLTDFVSAINWLGFAETLEMVTGGWILIGAFTNANPQSRFTWIARPGNLRIATLLFGASLPLIGLSHFVYAKETAQMIPDWFPARLDLAYLTGGGHIAAGIAVLLNVLPRLAVTLETCMMGSFVLLLHIPAVISDPTSRFQWTMLSVATAITGAAAIVAKQFANRPWGLDSMARSKPAVKAPNVAQT